MAKRDDAADPTKPAVASKRKPSAAQKAAGRANVAKGRAKKAEQTKAAKEAGLPRASERWAQLLDGSLTVQDLDNEELAKMRVRGADGGFSGRRPAVPSHLAQAMQKEAIKRATEMFRNAAPKAVKRLLEIADDPETKDADAIRALDIVLNRGLGKMPETVLIEEKSKWEGAQDGAFSGVDRDSVDNIE